MGISTCVLPTSPGATKLHSVRSSEIRGNVEGSDAVVVFGPCDFLDVLSP